MYSFRFFCCFLLLVQDSVPAEVFSTTPTLPSWITNDPGFQRPTEIDSIRTGRGNIRAEGPGNFGWLVHCNEKEGHGVELDFEILSLTLASEGFLMVAPWPLVDSFARVKLYSGKFGKKKLLIPNTKSLRVLYSSTENSSKFNFTYSRYGTHIEDLPLPTENPKKKETIFEVQFKGKPPKEYLDEKFLGELKKAVKNIAREYSILHNVAFNDSIPIDEMVRVHRISYCPFEWPNRELCASIEHSVFVSGVRRSDGFIADYQLTADHLAAMWSEKNFTELEALGVTVFRLPQTATTLLYWFLIITGIAALSLIGSFLFWRRNYSEIRSKQLPLKSEKKKKVRRPKLEIGKEEKIPSFMFAEINGTEMTSPNTRDDTALKEKYNKVIPADSGEQPIKNYYGSFLFGSNRAFDEDEDFSVERRQKPTE